MSVPQITPPTPGCNYFCVLFLSLCWALGVLVKHQQRCSLSAALATRAPIKKESLLQKMRHLKVNLKESG